MSVLAVSDFVFGDLLTDLNIKPWWEKLRGYCFAASVVAALFMTYIILPTPSVKCTPLIVNNTIKSDYSTTQSYLINNYCSNQVPWFISFAGVAALCCSVFILMAASWWTHHPEVINSFRTFAQFEEIIEKLKLTPDQLCLLSSKPLNTSSTDECREVRKACLLLWKYESPIRVDLFYKIRNVVLLVISLMSAALSVFILHSLFDDGNKFECSLAMNDEFEIYGTANEMRLHFCSHNATKKLVPFMLAYLITLSSQTVFVVIAILKVHSTRHDIQSLHLTKHGRKAARYSCFMGQFWKNSKPISCGSLNQLVDYIFCNALSEMSIILRDADLQDIEMIGQYSCLSRSGSSYIIHVLSKLVKEKSFSVTNSVHGKVVECIKSIKLVHWCLPLKIFMDYLYEQKYWELLWNVLVLKKNGVENSHYTNYSYTEYLRSLDINLDEIGQPYSLGRSILYYTTPEKPSRAIITEPSMISIREQIRFRVHFDGKCMLLEDFVFGEFFSSEMFESFCASQLKPVSEPTVSQKSIRIMFEEHQAATKNLKPVFQDLMTLGYVKPYEDFENYMLKFAEKLSRYKFHQWDMNIKNLAAFANSEKQWPVFVELLNAFIVIEPHDPHTLRDPPDFDCGVINFTVSSERDEVLLLHKTHSAPSLLYYALRKPDYQPKFLFTAIRHILNCTRGQEKIVRLPDGREKSAINFVRESENNLDANDVEIIIWMLNESMEPLHGPDDQDVQVLEETKINIPQTQQNDKLQFAHDKEEFCNENESLLQRSKSVTYFPHSSEVKGKRHSCFL